MKQIAATQRYAVEGSAALAATFSPGVQVSISQIKFTLAANGTGTDTFTANLSSSAGSPAGSLVSQVMTGITTCIKTYEPPIILMAGDTIPLAYPNSGSAAYGAEIVYYGIF
jgi:hypothetical protein